MANEIGYLGNPKLKNINSKQGFTEYQISELSKCADDVIYFTENYIKIRNVDEENLINLILRDYQIDLIRLMTDERFVICKIPRQYGKALALDTPIKTPSGWKQMGNIKVGDKIFGDDGKPTEVSFITETMYNHECYEITFDNGEKITADADHLWKFNYDWDHKEKTCTTKELIPFFEASHQKGYGTSIKISEPLHFTSKKLPISPYVLGVWLGDGYSSGGRYICLHSDNVVIKTEIEKLGYKVKINSSKKGKSGKKIDRNNIIGLNKILRLNNLKNNKHIPEIYLQSSFKQRLELLQGLMDTDGFCNPKVGTCEFYQKKLSLIESVRELLSSLGIKSRKRFRIIKGEKYYTLVFNTHVQVFKLPRKFKRQLKSKHHPKNYNFYIQSIKKVKSVPVKCIQVENKDHMFLCGKTMIPTHNSTTYVAYILWYLIFHNNVEVALLANKGQTARELLSRIQIAWENLPSWIQQGIVVWNKGSIELENGSKIIATNTASNSIRGYSFNLIVLDEFAHIDNNLAEEFFRSTYPAISSGKKTKIFIVSTPKGMNLYWKLWMEATKPAAEKTSKFVPFEVHWTVLPGRDEAWRQQEIANLGSETAFDQEYGTFVSHTYINIRDKKTGKESQITIGEFYEILKKENGSSIVA